MNLLAQYNHHPLFLYEFAYFSVDDVRMNRQEWIGKQNWKKNGRWLLNHLILVGSYHESELQFIFGEAYLNYSNHLRSYDDKKMSDVMMNLWTNFAKHG